MVFSVEFDRMLYFQGFDGILGWIVVIFDGVKSGEMLIFQCFVELITELENSNQRVDGRDMPFPAIEHSF